MGTWGFKTFENDNAGDWVYDLEDSKDRTVIHSALNRILKSGEYLEASDCQEGLAAAEVVLAGVSGDRARVTEEVGAWLDKKHGLFRKRSVDFDGTDVRLATDTCEKILNESELKELWAESEEYAKWEADVKEIVSRLSVHI